MNPAPRLPPPRHLPASVRRRIALTAAAFLAGGWLNTLAVIFHSTGDPDYNTTEPIGALGLSGWQWVGKWGSSTGTPVGPHHFLAARHIGGAIGQALVLGAGEYVTKAYQDDPESDLRIWETATPFPTWAPLCRVRDEVGRMAVIFGRGYIRGEDVRDTMNGELRGWRWSPGDGRLRWGTNRIHAEVNRGAGWGTMLYALFENNGNANEVHLAVNDSGAPMFINNGQGWKLAGIAGAVDAHFNTSDSGPGFDAAIFDARNLHFGREGKWTKRLEGPKPLPSGFYCTRISARADWIDRMISGSDDRSNGQSKSAK